MEQRRENNPTSPGPSHRRTKGLEGTKGDPWGAKELRKQFLTAIHENPKLRS